VERLLVVRLGSLGDLVHTLPAVAAIRRAHPAATIDWLVDAVHREFLSLVPVLSSTVTLAAPTMTAWMAARRQLRANRYDAAIDFQGLLKSAALARLSGATRAIGFARPALREPAAALFYTERHPVGEGRHVIAKNLQLATAVGAAPDAPIEFPLRVSDSLPLKALKAGGLERYALLNCGAAWPNKRWPPARFGRVAAWLAERHGLASVVLWGPGEAAIADEVVANAQGAALRAPQTSLSDLVALCREAALMVSGDTGPTHIAGAVGTPIVALFGPTSADRNGPWAPADVSLSRFEHCDCHYERRCRRGADGWCLADITEQVVEAAIDARLGTRPAA
jgi:lipopolysaccharide heptosyltransferase I